MKPKQTRRCPHCNGRGYFPGDPEANPIDDCQKCGGSGKITEEGEMSETCCPFCGRDPFHRVDNGVGMEAVAVTCCELGDLYFRGARAAPEEVTLSWEEFTEIGSKLTESAAEIERLRALTSRDAVLEEAAAKNDAMAKRLRLLARDLADYAKAHAEGGYEYLEQTAAAIRSLKKDTDNG